MADLTTTPYQVLIAHLPLALHGRHQTINTSLALAALEILEPVFPVTPQAMTEGLQHVKWPGRMELISVQHA